jgi:hypothetical protein
MVLDMPISNQRKGKRLEKQFTDLYFAARNWLWIENVVQHKHVNCDGEFLEWVDTNIYIYIYNP